jgi:hypothetical protein
MENTQKTQNKKYRKMPNSVKKPKSKQLLVWLNLAQTV